MQKEGGAAAPPSFNSSATILWRSLNSASGSLLRVEPGAAPRSALRSRRSCGDGAGAAFLYDKRRQGTDAAIDRLDDTGDHPVVGAPLVRRDDAAHVAMVIIGKLQ